MLNKWRQKDKANAVISTRADLNKKNFANSTELNFLKYFLQNLSTFPPDVGLRKSKLERKNLNNIIFRACKLCKICKY